MHPPRAGSKVQGSKVQRFKVQGSKVQGSKVQGSKVQGSRYKVHGSGFRVQRFKVLQPLSICHSGPPIKLRAGPIRNPAAVESL